MKFQKGLVIDTFLKSFFFLTVVQKQRVLKKKKTVTLLMSSVNVCYINYNNSDLS